MTIEKLLPTHFQRLQVSPTEEGMRLIDLLINRDSSLSASAWRQRVDQQLIWIDAQPAHIATRKLHTGTQVLVISPIEDDWKILDRNKGLVALYKPPGVVFDDIHRQKNIPHLPTLYPVHRLDKMTSGLLIMAEDSSSAAQVIESFKQRKLNKKYLAFVWGKPNQSSGVIKTPLLKRGNIHGGVRMQAAAGNSRQQALDACTSWQLLGHRNGISLLLCQPLSGRTHQIRAHLQEIGCPVVGDAQYQTPIPPKPWRGNIATCQHMLHAWRLELNYQGDQLVWTAPFSPEFERFFNWIDPKGKIQQEMEWSSHN